MHVKALILLITELGIILAFSLLFSVLSSPTLAAIFTIGFYIIGHFNDMVGTSDMDEKRWLIPILELFHSIMPNLEFFNIRAAVVLENPVNAIYVTAAIVYGFLYIAIALTLAALAFGKKDLS
jgi:hypothetical protein